MHEGHDALDRLGITVLPVLSHDQGTLRKLNFLLDSKHENALGSNGFVSASWYTLRSCPLLTGSNQR